VLHVLAEEDGAFAPDARAQLEELAQLRPGRRRPSRPAPAPVRSTSPAPASTTPATTAPALPAPVDVAVPEAR